MYSSCYIPAKYVLFACTTCPLPIDNSPFFDKVRLSNINENGYKSNHLIVSCFLNLTIDDISVIIDVHMGPIGLQCHGHTCI